MGQVLVRKGQTPEGTWVALTVIHLLRFGHRTVGGNGDKRIQGVVVGIDSIKKMFDKFSRRELTSNPLGDQLTAGIFVR